MVSLRPFSACNLAFSVTADESQPLPPVSHLTNHLASSTPSHTLQTSANNGRPFLRSHCIDQDGRAFQNPLEGSYPRNPLRNTANYSSGWFHRFLRLAHGLGVDLYQAVSQVVSHVGVHPRDHRAGFGPGIRAVGRGCGFGGSGGTGTGNVGS